MSKEHFNAITSALLDFFSEVANRLEVRMYNLNIDDQNMKQIAARNPSTYDEFSQMEISRMARTKRKLYWESIYAILTDVELFMTKKKAGELSGNTRHALDSALKEQLIRKLLPKMPQGELVHRFFVFQIKVWPLVH